MSNWFKKKKQLCDFAGTVSICRGVFCGDERVTLLLKNLQIGGF
jgi:hypothetical protein